MQVFVTTKNVGMEINAELNPNNCLTKVYAIRHLFGVEVIMSVNVINHVILVSI